MMGSPFLMSLQQAANGVDLEKRERRLDRDMLLTNRKRLKTKKPLADEHLRLTVLGYRINKENLKLGVKV